MFQDVRKKDDKVRTFAPSDNTTKASFLEDDYDEEKKSTDKYKKIDLHDIKGLIDRIDSKVAEENDIVDLGNNEKNYFRDVNNFLYDIMNGKINDFNKEKKYEKRLKNIEKKLANRRESSEFTKLYEQVITALNNILFSNKKSSERGLAISSLPILLSKMYNNS